MDKPIDPMARIVIAGWRGQAIALDAIASDMERAGIAAIGTRAQAQTLRERADEHERGEQIIANARTRFRPSRLRPSTQ